MSGDEGRGDAITVNGARRPHEAPQSLDELLRTLGYRERLPFVAVAVNRRCVPRAAHATTTVVAGDEVEILAPMAGG
jgi:thiamine biosynthesis protein ThiS